MFSSIARPIQFCALSILGLQVGCATVGPDYVPPTTADAGLPAQWSSPNTPNQYDAAAASAPWWAELSDPALNRLIDAAFNSSPTLEAAIAKLGQSRSQSIQARAAGLPTADAKAGSERIGGEGSAGQTSWLSTNASWELDLFGAVQRGNEGALARTEAQAATLADVRVSLAADVTDAYLSQRACQSLEALSEQDVASRLATGRLIAASIESGFTAPYEGIHSTASIAEARARLTAAKAQCQQLENLLTRLSGIPRPPLMLVLAELPTGLNRLPVPRHFSVAIPSQAVMQRPDIRAAERRLAAAAADIGLAEADRYPRVSLNGSLGYSTTNSKAGTLSFGIWSFGPTVSLPLFDAGRRKTEVDIAQFRYEETLADFKAKTRNAIQEIEDALTRYASAHERAENARLAASEYQRFFNTIEERHREGASNLLELEDARRAMLDAQQTLLNVQQERLRAWVALNRATGGAAQYQPDTAAQTHTQPPPAS